MIFAWKASKIRIRPGRRVPTGTRRGHSLPASRSYASPVVANGQVTLFTSQCTQLFIACTAGTVTATTVADNLIATGHRRRPTWASPP